MSDFRASFATQVQTVAQQPEAAEPLPVELWVMDESRFGLHTLRARRLTLRGVKPIGCYQFEFHNFYVYGLVAPRTGESFFATQRSMSATDFGSFVQEFAAQRPERFHILLLDNARSHHATTLALPSNVALLFLPPYAPELNPCERVWQVIKQRCAWRTFPSLFALQEALAPLLDALTPPFLRSLTNFPFLRPALASLPSVSSC